MQLGREASIRRRFKAYWRAFLAATSFGAFGVGGLMLSLLILPIAYALPGSIFERRIRCQRIVAATFRLFHYYMRAVGLVDYLPERKVPFDAPPSVWIANHPSLVDVSAVVAAHPELCLVVKASVFDSPLFRPLMACCGHIRVDRDDPESGLQALQIAEERLRAGHSVLIFPEGTRSPDSGLNPFHPGAFAMAVAAGVPIQPLLIRAGTSFLKRGTPWYKVPASSATLRISALPALDTYGAQVTSRGLCKATERLLDGALKAPA